jgi:hypothetical protein
MRRIQAEGFQKLGAEENIWTYKEEVQNVENGIM